MSSSQKVLIIDDEIDLCVLLKIYLVKKNFDVHYCHSLKDGVDYIDTLNPDILFLDNNLPDGMGWILAPKLAADFPDMHINLISAFHPSLPSMPPQAKYNVIEKPISFTDLDRQL